MSSYRSIEWRGDSLRLLDQRLLPHELAYVDCVDHRAVASAIRDMVVRGAPAIGAAAAYGLALAALGSHATTVDALRGALEEAGRELRATRPTAVNLFWAIDRVMRCVMDPAISDVEQARQAVIAEARAIAEEDARVNRSIGLHGLALVPDPARIIHHCNTGSLATVDYGTALGVIRAAHEHGRRVHVFVDETRPRLQGARLTIWELRQLGVPCTLIVDGAAAYVMKTRGIDLCLVGCDRVARNGDTANKLGTYHLALAAHAHGIPFYIAGPTSTIDLSIPHGDAIPIEERPAVEVTHVGNERVTPDGVEVFNPAFDVTPARYITAIITEVGVAYPPYEESLPRMVRLAESTGKPRGST